MLITMLMKHRPLLLAILTLLFIASCAAPTYIERTDPQGVKTIAITVPTLGAKATAAIPTQHGLLILSADSEEGWADWTNLGLAKALAPAATAVGGGIGSAVSKLAR